MSEESFREVWTETGTDIANGGKFNRSHLLAIYGVLDLSKFDPTYLPNESTVEGTLQERKDAVFAIAERIWGITPGGWLKMEKTWLDESRQVSGSPEVNGKDKISDVVSAEILLRIIAAAKIVAENKDGREVEEEAITAINIILAEVCAKGRTRMMRVNGHSAYGNMKRAGLMIGTGGGKYLPYPTKALPELLLFLLDKKNITPEAYL